MSKVVSVDISLSRDQRSPTKRTEIVLITMSVIYMDASVIVVVSKPHIHHYMILTIFSQLLGSSIVAASFPLKRGPK